MSNNLPATQNVPPSETKGEVDAITRSAMEHAAHQIFTFNKILHCTPGLTIAVVNRGKTVGLAAGYRDASRSMSMDDKGNYLRLRDPMAMCGFTVPITSYAALLLHDDKKIDLDVPLRSIVKKLDVAPDITLRTLLCSHTTLRDKQVLKLLGYSSAYSNRKQYEHVYPHIEAKLPNRTLLREFFYSNTKNLRISKIEAGKVKSPSYFGVALACSIIEKMLNKPYETLVTEKVFKDKETNAVTCGYGTPEVKQPKTSHLFYQTSGTAKAHWGEKVVVDTHVPLPNVLLPAIGLYGTIEDAGIIMRKVWPRIGAEATSSAPTTGIKFSTVEGHYGVHVLRKKNLLMCYHPVILPVFPLPASASFIYSIDLNMGCAVIATSGTVRASFLSRLGVKSGIRVFQNYVLKHGDDETPAKDEESPLRPKDLGMATNFIQKKTTPTRF
eukprot:PhF_6_TR14274/c0_g1_i1/m.22957